MIFKIVSIVLSILLIINVLYIRRLKFKLKLFQRINENRINDELQEELEIEDF